MDQNPQSQQFMALINTMAMAAMEQPRDERARFISTAIAQMEQTVRTRRPEAAAMTADVAAKLEEATMILVTVLERDGEQTRRA